MVFIFFYFSIVVSIYFWFLSLFQPNILCLAAGNRWSLIIADFCHAAPLFCLKGPPFA